MLGLIDKSFDALTRDMGSAGILLVLVVLALGFVCWWLLKKIDRMQARYMDLTKEAITAQTQTTAALEALVREVNR